MVDSIALIWAGARPVAVRLCLGRLKFGPTGPARSGGAPMLGRRELAVEDGPVDFAPEGEDISSGFAVEEEAEEEEGPGVGLTPTTMVEEDMLCDRILRGGKG